MLSPPLNVAPEPKVLAPMVLMPFGPTNCPSELMTEFPPTVKAAALPPVASAVYPPELEYELGLLDVEV